MAEEKGHPFFAAFYGSFGRLGQGYLQGQVEKLLHGKKGRLLEVGAGPGFLFPLYGKRKDLQVTAVEPDPYMRRQAEGRARQFGVELLPGRAEELPFPDESFDYVLTSLVLCTVQEPKKAIREMARVLRPGGELLFLEHVRGEGWRGRGQDLLRPLWEKVAGGCQLNRPTQVWLQEEPLLQEIEWESLPAVWPVQPILLGKARRRAMA
ncbi:MAG: class I SAM-dependent methyltransferase [Clostridiales bacterium]|nr:class I SAM-dependent methyltransferase [Clostridiales bacterium]